jgi:hypothetical protein
MVFIEYIFLTFSFVCVKDKMGLINKAKEYQYNNKR